MHNKQTPLSYLLQAMTTDSSVFASKQFSEPIHTWLILLFTTNEMIPHVSVRIQQETDGTFSLGDRGEFDE